MIRKIAVIGLGQIGGSLVLALRKRKIPCLITGIDRSRKRLRLLHDQLDGASTSWKAISDPDAIFVCLHFHETMRFLSEAPPGRLLVDVCSGKEKVLRYANRKMLRLIGGHPLAGNEREEEAGWDPDLFDDRPFFLFRSNGTTGEDYQWVARFIKKLGARPVKVAPETHDAALALTSHFPAVLSLLLAELASGVSPMFRGPGYESMTRLARTSPKLLETFLASNRANILKSARRMQRLLDRWIRTHR